MTELADQTVTVLDIISQQPIPGASVTIGGVTVMTDENGVATFPSPPPASMPGPTAATTPGKITPARELAAPNTVTVTADWYFPNIVALTGESIEVDLWPYSLPIAIGAIITLGAVAIVGAKASGWF